jgi:hypothetical protein
VGKIQWKALLNMVINLWVLSKVENFLTTRIAIKLVRTLFHAVNLVHII